LLKISMGGGERKIARTITEKNRGLGQRPQGRKDRRGGGEGVRSYANKVENKGKKYQMGSIKRKEGGDIRQPDEQGPENGGRKFREESNIMLVKRKRPKTQSGVQETNRPLNEKNRPHLGRESTGKGGREPYACERVGKRSLIRGQ